MKSFEELIETLEDKNTQITTITSKDTPQFISGCVHCKTLDEYVENSYSVQVKPFQSEQLPELAKALNVNKSVMRIDSHLFINFIDSKTYQKTYEAMHEKMTASDIILSEKTGEIHSMILENIWNNFPSSLQDSDLSSETCYFLFAIKNCLDRNNFMAKLHDKLQNKLNELKDYDNDLKIAQKSFLNRIREYFGLKNSISTAKTYIDFCKDDIASLQFDISFISKHSKVSKKEELNKIDESSIQFSNTFSVVSPSSLSSQIENLNPQILKI